MGASVWHKEGRTEQGTQRDRETSEERQAPRAGCAFSKEGLAVIQVLASSGPVRVLGSPGSLTAHTQEWIRCSFSSKGPCGPGSYPPNLQGATEKQRAARSPLHVRRDYYLLPS